MIIIGILAAIAIPAFLNQRERAWRSVVESDLRNAAIAIETCYTRDTAYPTDYRLAAGTDPTCAPCLTGVDVQSLTATRRPRNNGQTFMLTGSNTNLTEELTYDSCAGGLSDWAFPLTCIASDVTLRRRPFSGRLRRCRRAVVGHVRPRWVAVAAAVVTMLVTAVPSSHLNVGQDALAAAVAPVGLTQRWEMFAPELRDVTLHFEVATMLTDGRCRVDLIDGVGP